MIGEKRVNGQLPNETRIRIMKETCNHPLGWRGALVGRDGCHCLRRLVVAFSRAGRRAPTVTKEHAH